MIIIASVLLIASSLLMSSSLRITRKPAYLVSVFLCAYANLVLVSEAASLLRQMNQVFFLFGHGILALTAWIVWWRTGKMNLLGPFNHLPRIHWNLSSLTKAADLLFFTIIIGLVYLGGACLILFTPQNNFDSMTYHLSRVGYWLQQSSLSPWNTPNPRQTTFPINAELGILWTVIFWGSDQLSGFVQWITVPILVVIIIGLARLFGASRKQSLFAALIWLSFPEIFLQSVTTMNDLVVTVFFVGAVYMGFLGLCENSRSYLLLAGLGIGLAMGTKSTAWILLPGFFLGVGLILLVNWQKNFRNILLWGIASLIAFFLVGSLGYIQNLIYYHNPFSISQWTEGLVSLKTSRAEYFFENSILYINQAIDWTGLPPFLYQPLSQFNAKAMLKLISYLPFANAEWFIDARQSLNFILYSPKFIHEDLAWFGPLFLILYIPSCTYHLIIGIKRKDAQRLALLILTIGFSLTICFIMGWSPYKGRYFPLAITFSAPFLAIFFQPAKKWLILRWVITIAAAVVISRTFLYNRSKPLVGENSIWGKDVIAVQTINNPSMEPILRMVDKHVPVNSRLATKLGINSWDYPLFGNRFQRTIIQTDPFDTTFEPEWFQRQAVDYLLIEPKERWALEIPTGFELIDEVDGWTLYAPCSKPICEPDPEVADNLLGASDKDNLLTIAPDLVGKVGVLELRPNSWGIEQLNGKGILWLGEGSLHGLTGYLWSDAERNVQIRIELEPGPSKSKPASTLLFSLYWIRGYLYSSQGENPKKSQFDKPTTITFFVNLNKGLNEFKLSSQDIAEFRNLANGDTRPLLILIKHIRIE